MVELRSENEGGVTVFFLPRSKNKAPTSFFTAGGVFIQLSIISYIIALTSIR